MQPRAGRLLSLTAQLASSLQRCGLAHACAAELAACRVPARVPPPPPPTHAHTLTNPQASTFSTRAPPCATTLSGARSRSCTSAQRPAPARSPPRLAARPPTPSCCRTTTRCGPRCRCARRGATRRVVRARQRRRTLGASLWRTRLHAARRPVAAASTAMLTQLPPPPPPHTSMPCTQALSKAGAADLAQLLEYHVVPGFRPVPTGWKSGERVATLLTGHTLGVRLGQRCVCACRGVWACGCRGTRRGAGPGKAESQSKQCYRNSACGCAQATPQCVRACVGGVRVCCSRHWRACACVLTGAAACAAVPLQGVRGPL
jgi:hypothetical protein